MTNNILNIIENARNWIRTLAVSVSSFRSHFSQIAALAAFLLFIGVGNAWGYIYVDVESNLNGGNVGNGDVFATSEEFENIYGIDQISYTYNANASNCEGITIEYTLDGSDWKKFNEKSTGHEANVVDVIPATHEARKAICFRFKGRFSWWKSGWCAVWNLQIRRSMSARINGEEWKGNRKWRGPHVEFTMDAPEGSYDGTYKELDIKKNQNNTITWVVDPGYTINVSQINIGLGGAGFWTCTMNINGEDVATFYTTTGSDYTFSGYSLGNDGSFIIKTTENIDLYNVTIAYTIKANAPTASSHSMNVSVAGTPSTKDIRELFSVPASQVSHFTLSYEENDGFDHIAADGHTFSSDSAGTFTVRAKVNTDEDYDHEESDWQEATITVNRLPNTLYVKGSDNYKPSMRLCSTIEDVTLTATNTDYTKYPIYCSQVLGEDTIDFNQATGVITSSAILGTARWHITQAQSNQYEAGDNYFTVKVINDTCIFTGEGSWEDEGNWLTPKPSDDDDYASIKVRGSLTIDEERKVYSILVEEAYAHAKITVSPQGGLTVGAGGITGITSSSRLVLEADDDPDSETVGQTGYLRISPAYKGDMPEATIKMYSTAYVDYSEDGIVTWQYMGIPLSANVDGWDICTYGQQFIYGWSEKDSEWFDAYEAEIEPFKGYCLTQNNSSTGLEFTFAGTLINKDTTINLSYYGAGEDQGYNVLANSYAAPIDISKLSEEDFGGADATIYIFNTGSFNESGYSEIKEGEDYTTAGQYIAVTPGTATSIYDNDKTKTYPVLIPAMQGFFVKATGAGATLKLDYKRLVWEMDYSTHPNKPMRVAAQKTNEPNVTDFIKVKLSDGEAADNLYLLASESYDKNYENGYDAPKMMSDDPALPNIFAVEDDGQFAIDATSDIEGTFLGVRTGAASSYTMSFTRVNCETEWMLLDIETDQKTLISEETSYSFFAEPNAMITDRFLIVEGDNVPAITTSVDNVENGAKVHKFIKDNQLFILKNGVLYDGMGRRIQ